MIFSVFLSKFFGGEHKSFSSYTVSKNILLVFGINYTQFYYNSRKTVFLIEMHPTKRWESFIVVTRVVCGSVLGGSLRFPNQSVRCYSPSVTVHKWGTVRWVRLRIGRIGEGLLGWLADQVDRTLIEPVKIKILGSASISNILRVGSRMIHFGRIERIGCPVGHPKAQAVTDVAADLNSCSTATRHVTPVPFRCVDGPTY